MRNAIEQNGVLITRTPKGVAVGFGLPFYPPAPNKVMIVEVEYQGRLLKSELIQTYGIPYRDYFGSSIDHCNCVIRVKDVESVIAELGLPEKDGEPLMPFMVRSGEQVHVTESYVSVPPALTITDELGAIWTLGMVKATKEQSPDGEFAFSVLRDGADTHQIASRIERRSGKIRVFTRHGWKRWLGREFS